MPDTELHFNPTKPVEFLVAKFVLQKFHPLQSYSLKEWDNYRAQSFSHCNIKCYYRGLASIVLGFIAVLVHSDVF